MTNRLRSSPFLRFRYAGRERVHLMSLRHFSIGQSVVYRIGRVNQGPFVIVSVIAQSRHGIRYRIRSQDDDTIEHVVELGTT